MRLLGKIVLFGGLYISLLATAKPREGAPRLEVVGEATVTRSGRRGSDGFDAPPWTKIEIANVFGFDQQPLVGQKVSVVAPSGLPTLELAITRVQERAEIEEAPVWWAVELEEVKDKRYQDAAPLPNRRADVPFDVVVLYPSVPSARWIPRKQLSTRDLPGGVHLKEVKAAVDLDGDGRSDVLVLDYCCGPTDVRPDGCDYHCGQTFIKEKGTWRKRAQSTPL